MSSIHRYRMRLDNSICDIVRLKQPIGCFEPNLKTVIPKPQEFYDAAFPHIYGVMICHINPNDTTNRQVFMYMNITKNPPVIDDHEKDLCDFKITPKKMYNLFMEKNYKEHIVIANLDNLEYVLPNCIKRDKILNDGATYCLIANLNDDRYPDSMKTNLAMYDGSEKDDSYIPNLADLGKVIDVVYKDLYPVKVAFPNGHRSQFNTDDLIFFHEI